MRKPTLLHFPIWALLAAFGLFFFARRVQAQDARLPRPNFSEMEKDYDIVKWTYESSGYIRLVIKPKHDPPHENKYGFKFFDADGVTIDGPKIIFNNGFSTPAGETEKGEAYAPDEATLRKVKSVIVYQVLSDGTLIGPKPSAIPAQASQPVGEKPPATKPAPQKPAATKSAQKGAGPEIKCSFEKQPASNARMKFSSALMKSLLYERYSFEKEIGGLSSPADIGVTFLSLKPLGSFVNTVTIVPGRGAQRKDDGAPVNAVIYRFHAKYLVCRKFSDSTRKTQYESDNVCFKAKNGAWDCAVDSVPQITELN